MVGFRCWRRKKSLFSWPEASARAFPSLAASKANSLSLSLGIFSGLLLFLWHASRRSNPLLPFLPGLKGPDYKLQGGTQTGEPDITAGTPTGTLSRGWGGGSELPLRACLVCGARLSQPLRGKGSEDCPSKQIHTTTHQDLESGNGQEIF